jgi:tetratricopeptide (TPR) repeat protein
MKRNKKNNIIEFSDKKYNLKNEAKALRLKMEADKLVVEGKPDEALEKYNLSIAFFDNAPTYIGRARACRELGEYELALYDLNMLDKFLQSNFMFSDYEVYFERGLVHERLWDMKSAFEDLKKFISICQERKVKITLRSKEEALKNIKEAMSLFKMKN